MATENLRRVDISGLKTGQALTIILLLLAFIIDGVSRVSVLLVALVAVAQLFGALDAPYGPYKLFYQQILKPSSLVKPNIINDNPEPHRFAMFVGAIFNGVATLLLLVAPSAAWLAWVLVWIVIVLANLNFWLNFCLGCWMYYQFNRLGVPGFKYAPIK